VQVRNKKIGLMQIDIEFLKPFLHGFKTFFTVEAGIDNQVSIVSFDYVRIEVFQWVVGQRYLASEKIGSNFLHVSGEFLFILVCWVS